jgi:GxxExxY protein
MMNQDDMSGESQFQFEKETSEILNCAFEVINTLGHGLLEKPYENSLCIEFTLRGIPWQQQPRYDVIYKLHKVGENIPDLIVHNLVVVDTKVIERITDHEIGQMPNYLKITGHPVGLIINFKRARLEWKRVINKYPKS